ncbi:Glyoxalase/Bleomycin resistance protein/Dihydroxybiphenyl dioxygenase [Choiromyces venosus 120613-1]|uniref:Glyoxalase/Bleomycin resistance protein/Dihydroxybiphenyl dioxygenase n=1 Tax=Choiromyces venosus 120613-1 TaxID=1336337 RepID=A0A3N4K3T0_9PEZI|nr:Glyoxalase/Bleomycin resistance protein/Dihydroxybiphenyl dioxygenase [Choiromyces venosus 120613-1]
MGFTSWTPIQHFSLVTLLCHEYEDALAFYAGLLNFSIHEDSEIEGWEPGKRFIALIPPKVTQMAPMVGLRVTRATTRRQQEAVGNQAGDAVFLFFEVDNFDETYGTLKACGVKFLEQEPREEKFGKAIVFQDPYGNRIDLIDRPTKRTGSLYARDASV